MRTAPVTPIQTLIRYDAGEGRERGGKWNLYETTHVTQEEVLSQIGKFLKIS